MTEKYSVVVVGGGQSGLAVSYYLTERKIDHVVLEKNSIANSWKSERWDSFCLVTPNWQCRLPGFPYQGSNPDGFMLKDEIVDYVEAYAKSFGAPVEEGITVTRICRSEIGSGFEVSTSAGSLSADQVVIAAGAYHRPLIPRIGEHLPASIVQLHSRDYRKPDSLPEGATLVVGSGQSGCQIAEDLHFAGRQVHLAVGTAPRSPRVYRAKDVVSWLEEMGYYDLPIDKHPKKDTVRTKTNHYVTGRNGGNEIDLRKHALTGMKLHGKLSDIQDGIIEFKGDLRANLDHADEVSESIKRSVDKYIADNGIDAPEEVPYTPVWQPPDKPEPLDCKAAGITSVIWSTGFGMDFSWVEVPVFNGNGDPGHERGVTAVQGLYFLGLPWLYTWGSGRFSHVGKDALFVADTIVANLRREQPQPTDGVNIVALGS